MAYAPTPLLSDAELSELRELLASKPIDKMIRDGGSWAIVFDQVSGIGINTSLSVRNKDYTELLNFNITDYSRW